MLKNDLKTALSIMGVLAAPLAFEVHGVESTSYAPGEKVRDKQLPGVCPQEAMYECNVAWDVTFTGDYLYWKWQQESLQIASIVPEGSGSLASFSGHSQTIFQNPSYASGFQTGVGLRLKGMDSWELYTQYTWYQNINKQTVSGTETFPFVLTSSNFTPGQSLGAEAHLVGTVNSYVKFGFQTIDLLFQRPFYFGQRLTANIGLGLQAQWISQKFNLDMASITDEETGLEGTEVFRHAKVSSWALGPELGFKTSWHLGYGIKILGNLAGSVLYTDYNMKAKRGGESSVGSVSGTGKGLHNYGTLRPVTESFLGLGWGSYLCNRYFHLDLSVGYDFNVYWNYDMLYSAKSQKNGNMYLHGMNIRGRYDF